MCFVAPLNACVSGKLVPQNFLKVTHSKQSWNNRALTALKEMQRSCREKFFFKAGRKGALIAVDFFLDYNTTSFEFTSVVCGFLLIEY